MIVVLIEGWYRWQRCRGHAVLLVFIMLLGEFLLELLKVLWGLVRRSAVHRGGATAVASVVVVVVVEGLLG